MKLSKVILEKYRRATKRGKPTHVAINPLTVYALALELNVPRPDKIAGCKVTPRKTMTQGAVVFYGY